MQNNEQNLETPSELQSFFFGQKEILVFENSVAIFDFCAADVFCGLCLATTPPEYSAIYKKLAVKYIAPARLFVDKKGNSISIKMLNLEGVKHLAKPLRTEVGKAFLHWATVDLPALAKYRGAKENTQSIDFQIFNFENLQNIRIILDKNGEPWFVAKDICDFLQIENVSQACEKLKDFEKASISIRYTSSNRDYQLLTISESGFYSLIFVSRKPEAEMFRLWITSEVLPTLRKTGKYEIAPKTPPSIEIIADAGFTPTQMEYLQKIIREAVLEANLSYQEQLAQIQNILPAFLPKLVKVKPSYVYLGQNQDNAHSKIGKSNEPLVRITILESGGSKILLLATLKVPSEKLALFWEGIFHEMFEDFAKGHEWFALSDTQINTLMKLMEVLNEYYESFM